MEVTHSLRISQKKKSKRGDRAELLPSAMAMGH
jgi:hypothetical protein